MCEVLLMTEIELIARDAAGALEEVDCGVAQVREEITRLFSHLGEVVALRDALAAELAQVAESPGGAAR